MATGAVVIDPAINTPTGGDKVEFTDAQQAKVQELIDTAVGRVANKVRKEYEPKVTDLQRQLDEAKEAARSATPGKKAGADADVQALQSQIEAAKANATQLTEEANRFKEMASQRDKDLIAAKAESIGIRKDVAITTSASKLDFVNLEVVKTLVKDSISWDADRKQFVVLNEQGQMRYDATLEHPLTIDAYLNEFAAKNKFLVRGNIAHGTGSSESMRSSLSSNGKHEVTEIFGPKSSSRLANDLAKSDPQEYKRLKGIAKQAGLVA